MIWHGQFDPPTDKVAASYFPDGFIGSLVDVGAADGEIISNTKAFEDVGWLALCIEPNPEYWQKLTSIRKHCQRYAVSNFSGRVPFILYKGQFTGHDAISSIRPNQRLAAAYSAVPDGKFDVDVRTLDQCIEEFGLFKSIDLVSIDTECTELEVLQGFSIRRWKPRLIVVENNYADPEIKEHMAMNGYRLDRTLVVNQFYVPLDR